MKLVDGIDEILPPAKGLDQLHRSAECGEGRDAQHGGVIEVEHTLVRILGQQRVEYGPRPFPVLVEHITLFDAVGPLAPGQRFGVEGDMADEVERIEVFAQPPGDDVERQAFGLQFLDDRLRAFGGFPAFEEVVEAGKVASSVPFW